MDLEVTQNMTIGDLLEKVGIVACLVEWPLVVYCPKHPEKGKFEIIYFSLPPDHEFHITYETPERAYPPFEEIPDEGTPSQIADSGIDMKDSAEGWVLSHKSMELLECGLAFVSREFESIKKAGLYEV